MSESLLTWIDSHVHWDAVAFDPDRDAALVRARAAGITHCINPAVSVSGFATLQSLAEASMPRNDWPCILPAYGIHPLYVMQAQSDDLAQLDAQLRIGCPIAVGEIGLDRFRGAPDFEIQRQWFEAQLALAVTYELPVILHLRHAVEDVIQTLKRLQGRSQKIPGGIAHAFNGSREQADQLIRMGFLLGFGGSCTYEGSTRIRTLLQSLPASAFVLETDAPDMAPAWLHGERNESSQLRRIAQTVALLREDTLATLATTTRENVRRIFFTDHDGARTQSVCL